MEMRGAQEIDAPISQVWKALNDEHVLKQCIPDCEEIVRESENVLTAKMHMKIGPVSARFSGRVELSDIDAPCSCRMLFQGQGGPAGFAKGEAAVRLQENSGKTTITYDAKASVGGKLAQIGSRLIDSTAKKIADQFFLNFKKSFSATESAPSSVSGNSRGTAMQESETATAASPQLEPPATLKADAATMTAAAAHIQLRWDRAIWIERIGWFASGAVVWQVLKTLVERF